MRHRPQTAVHVPAESARPDQDEAVHALRIARRECKPDAPAERVADERDVRVAELVEEIAQRKRVAPGRVVGVQRSIRLTVTQQIGRDDRVFLNQLASEPPPRARVLQQPVDEQQRQARPGAVIHEPPAVQDDAGTPESGHRPRPARNRRGRPRTAPIGRPGIRRGRAAPRRRRCRRSEPSSDPAPACSGTSARSMGRRRSRSSRPGAP